MPSDFIQLESGLIFDAKIIIIAYVNWLLRICEPVWKDWPKDRISSIDFHILKQTTSILNSDKYSMHYSIRDSIKTAKKCVLLHFKHQQQSSYKLKKSNRKVISSSIWPIF